jgi:hypothetical protein
VQSLGYRYREQSERFWLYGESEVKSADMLIADPDGEK